MGLFYKYVVLTSLVYHTEYKYMLPKWVLFFLCQILLVRDVVFGFVCLTNLVMKVVSFLYKRKLLIFLILDDSCDKDI